MGIYDDPNYTENKVSYRKKTAKSIYGRLRSHFIKPVYTDVESAPLFFYKFLSRFALFLGLLRCIPSSIEALTALSSVSSVGGVLWACGALDVIAQLFNIILIFISINGLILMDWSGVKAYLLIYCFSIAYNTFCAAIILYYGLHDSLTETVCRIILAIIWLYACAVYFGKRRWLFSPIPAYSEVEVPPLPAVEEEPAPPASDKKAHIVKVRRRIEGTVPLSVPVETVSSPVETIPVPVEEPEQAAPTKNNRRVKWAVIALSALCLVSIAGNVYQAYTANALSDKNDALATELEKKERSLSQKTARAGLYEDKYNELKKEYDSKSWSLFIAETQIGYVLDGDEYLYHNINCPIVQVELEYGTLYGIHNIEFCEWLGYVKCPLCWQETSQKS